MKKVLILGSTGSIGINTLKVLDRFPDQFQVVGLSASGNWRLLAEQIKQYRPRYAAIGSDARPDLSRALGNRKVRILDAGSELAGLAGSSDVDIVVLAVSGRCALEPFLAAVRAGKRVAPANKEALVIAGELIMAQAQKSGAQVIPVDSEQSAIFQCLVGQDRGELERVYLTASGGPLYNVAPERFDRLTVADILKHPRWKMGKKITVDSATLMNKGFEVIEAQRLFGLRTDEIEVVVHPQAIIHSMVGFRDGSILAQLSVTDMRLPIQYALTYPKRLPGGLKNLRFAKLKELTFASPDLKKFPCLKLALDVAKVGGTLPAVLNAADEEAVGAFLSGKIRFSRIYDVVARTVRAHRKQDELTLGAIQETDLWARRTARDIIERSSL